MQSCSSRHLPVTPAELLGWRSASADMSGPAHCPAHCTGQQGSPSSVQARALQGSSFHWCRCSYNVTAWFTPPACMYLLTKRHHTLLDEPCQVSDNPVWAICVTPPVGSEGSADNVGWRAGLHMLRGAAGLLAAATVIPHLSCLLLGRDVHEPPSDPCLRMSKHDIRPPDSDSSLNMT